MERRALIRWVGAAGSEASAARGAGVAASPASVARWAARCAARAGLPPTFATLWVIVVVLFPAVLLLAVPAPAAGQEGQEGLEDLGFVDALAAAGRTEEARAVLETWWDSERTRSSRRDRQRGLWLRAVLTVDPGMASLDYQRLVVGYPGGPYSDEALVRLAMIASSDTDLLGAAGYYRILLQDYPRSPERVRARQWLSDHSEEIEEAEEAAAEARAAAEAQAAADSTAALERAAPPAANSAAEVEPEVADSLPGVEEPEPAEPDSGVQDPVEEPAEQEAPEQEDASAEEVGGYAVQLGAFSTEEAADRFAETLAQAGFETRVVRVEGSPLVRVRVGRFAERSAASELMAEIDRLGYDAAVVSDVAKEGPIR